jgi:hypothetical protein
MSDSPIFDQLNSERDYDGILASFPKTQMSGFFAPSKQPSVPAQRFLEADPYLDGPFHVIEPQEEVLAQPFVKTEGVPRGTRDVKVEENISEADLEKSGSSLAAFTEYTVKKFYADNPGLVSAKISMADQLDGTKTLTVSGAVVEPEKPEELYAKVIGVPMQIFQNQMEAHGITSPDCVLAEEASEAMDLYRETAGALLEDVRKAFAEEHPGHVMTAVTAIQEHEDGSATLTVEGQALTPVQPLSERNTA